MINEIYKRREEKKRDRVLSLSFKFFNKIIREFNTFTSTSKTTREIYAQFMYILYRSFHFFSPDPSLREAIAFSPVEERYASRTRKG